MDTSHQARPDAGLAQLALDPRRGEEASSSGDPSVFDWHPILPINIEAPAELMSVSSKCSSSHSTWEAANPIMYNVRLLATRDRAAVGRPTAHVAAVDLAAHSDFFDKLFSNRKTFPGDTNDLQSLPVGIAVSQHHLHAIVGALYSGEIRIDARLVEPLLRTADYLQMPCLSDACVAYILKHLVQAAPVEVYMLGKELQLAELVKRAEATVLQAEWGGSNLQHLRALLEGRSPAAVREFLSSPKRSAVSELEVVEVLRSLSHRDELVEAINFGLLGKHEVGALGRVLRTLPREERSSQFWIDISDQVIHGLSDSPQAHPNQPGMLLWAVDAKLLTDPQPQGTRIDSGYFAADGRKYQGSIVYDSHGDAGLFLYPEPMHCLVEFGKRALVTVFVLSQTAHHPLILKRRLWTPGDSMTVGGGFGQPHCKGHLVNDLDIGDISVRAADGAPQLFIGMHVRHQDVGCDLGECKIGDASL